MKRLFSVIVVLAVIASLVTGCTGGATQGEVAETDGKGSREAFLGSAPGYHGELKVSVELDDAGKILSIDVMDHEETPDIGTIPIEKLPDAIVASQSLKVDAITGATVTTDALVAAVACAIDSAGFDSKAYGYEAKTSSSTDVYVLDLESLPVKAPKTDSITLKDAKGRDVELDLPISTYGMSTMDVIDFIIPLLGEDAFKMLVASGQDGGGGLQGYARLYTPIVGKYMNHVGQISDHNAPFDLEMILATDPDVLIVNSAMGAHKYALEVEDQLTQAGIPIVLIDVPGQNFSTSVQDTARLLGEIFQKQDRAQELISFIDAQYQHISSKNLASREDKPTFYYEKSGYSEIFGSTSSSATGWGTVMAMAGGDNIADPILMETAGAKGGGNTLDPEYVLQADPDFILLSGSGAGWMDNFSGSSPSVPKFDILNRTGWKELKAVKEGHVYELAHATSRSVFGFHAANKLAKIFYPDDFTDMDPDAIMDEFFRRFMLVDSDVTGWVHRAPEEVH